MNIEIIKKLIKLANNNPNDNEANQAARKVCSLLKDYEFESGVAFKNADISEADFRKPYNNPYNPFDPEYVTYKPFKTRVILNKCIKCDQEFLDFDFTNTCLSCKVKNV